MDRVATVSVRRHRHVPGARVRGLAVGTDVGGTWIRVATDHAPGVLTVRSTREPAVLARLLRALWRRRGFTRGRVDALVVASRGVWTAGECAALAHRLRGLARRVRVVPDAQAAHRGALVDRPGVLLLAGTGSIVVGRDARGRWARAGGLGPLLGDEGSAFSIGREWLRAASRGGRWQAALAAGRAAEPVARIAALAPAVLRRARRGDRRARAIARRAQAALAEHARDVVRQLRLRAPVDASWAGSVLEDAWFRRGLVRALARAGVRARWRRPATTPAAAALRMATRLRAGR